MYTLLKTLLAETEGPCVTILLPLMKGAAHGRENMHRLKRLIDESQIKLDSFGLSGKGQMQFLAAARQYADHEFNLATADDTLCMFISRAIFEVQVIPGSHEEAVIVGRRFHITPLLPSFYGPLHFGVLALSRKKAHFLEVRGQEVHQIDIDGMPADIASVFANMELTAEIGIKKDSAEMETQTYCKHVAAAVDRYLAHHYIPVVLCGVKELWGVYRAHDHSGFLCSDAVIGSPDRISYDDLALKALPIAAQAAQHRVDGLLATYAQLAGTGRTATDMGEILDAAIAGKVETLLLAQGAEQWGIVKPDGEKTLCERKEEGSEELYGLTAIHTMQHRGHVAVAPQANMPEERQIAAILRL